MKNKNFYIKLFLPSLAILLGIFGTIYLVVQQNYRQNANDPQIQMAYDLRNILNSSNSIKNINYPTVDPSISLNTFVIIYNNNLNITYSSVSINGKTPNLPSAVLYNVDQTSEDKLTWQPSGNIRIAAVVVRYKNGYILVGRSLKLIEERENQLTQELSIGFITTAFLTFLSLIFITII